MKSEFPAMPRNAGICRWAEQVGRLGSATAVAAVRASVRAPVRAPVTAPVRAPCARF